MSETPHAARALLLQPLPEGYHFAEYDPEQAWALHEIDRKGTLQIACHGFPSLAREPMPSIEWYRDWLSDHIVFVAADTLNRPVGFTVAAEAFGVYYLHMLSVDPRHGRRGVGAALLEANVARGRWAYHNAIALSTFRSVPFNAPFYARQGFVEADLAAVDPELRAQFLEEVPKDILPSTRCLMMRRL